jgi:hypothetical protein
MTAATCKVLRDGKQITLHERRARSRRRRDAGGRRRVPADARLLESASLKAEEAALTGESVPVSKYRSAGSRTAAEVPLGDRKNMVYMGSTVVYGRGRAVDHRTGMDTEMGKIAARSPRHAGGPDAAADQAGCNLAASSAGSCWASAWYLRRSACSAPAGLHEPQYGAGHLYDRGQPGCRRHSRRDSPPS